MLAAPCWNCLARVKRTLLRGQRPSAQFACFDELARYSRCSQWLRCRHSLASVWRPMNNARWLQGATSLSIAVSGVPTNVAASKTCAGGAIWSRFLREVPAGTANCRGRAFDPAPETYLQRSNCSDRDHREPAGSRCLAGRACERASVGTPRGHVPRYSWHQHQKFGEPRRQGYADQLRSTRCPAAWPRTRPFPRSSNHSTMKAGVVSASTPIVDRSTRTSTGVRTGTRSPGFLWKSRGIGKHQPAALAQADEVNRRANIVDHDVEGSKLHVDGFELPLGCCGFPLKQKQPLTPFVAEQPEKAVPRRQIGKPGVMQRIRSDHEDGTTPVRSNREIANDQWLEFKNDLVRGRPFSAATDETPSFGPAPLKPARAPRPICAAMVQGQAQVFQICQGSMDVSRLSNGKPGLRTRRNVGR